MNAVCRRLLFVLALFVGIHQSPASGVTLGIKPSGKAVVLSWPNTATNFVLQSTPTLSAANWLAVTNPVTLTANINSVTYTNNSVTRFFRLYFNASTGFYLSIARSNNQLVVFWPTAATNYVLQTSVSLSPASWTAVTSPAPVTLNNTNFVSYTNNSSTRFFRLSLNTNTVSPLAGMVQIPAGPFTLGDVTDTNLDGDAAPVSVTLSAFYIDTNLVSLASWQSVYNWATAAGYGFVNAGSGKGPNHPVQTINWYDAVVWCNARSQQAGLTPVYYTDAGFNHAYTNGQAGAATIYANWAATGFRLPTEAEWEKAARGGLAGMRFPWGNTISLGLANYYGDTAYFYDSGPNGDNYLFGNGGVPFTSPVGFFGPNGYGLYDMAGNVCQWCWDWYGPYVGGTDPHGASSGSYRVIRGGDWGDLAYESRCADRNSDLGISDPGSAFFSIGFRCVRGH